MVALVPAAVAAVLGLARCTLWAIVWRVATVAAALVGLWAR